MSHLNDNKVDVPLGVNPNNEHQKYICYKGIQLRAQNLSTFREREREREFLTILQKTMNLHFDDEMDIHKSFENYEDIFTYTSWN